jgi:hypothetical protein
MADELTEEERCSILDSATALKTLGVDVSEFLAHAARAERAVSPRFPITYEPWGEGPAARLVPVTQVDIKEIIDAVQTMNAAVRNTDALFSPTILNQISSMRAARAYLGVAHEAGFWSRGDLDRVAKAVRLRSDRGRRPIPIREEVQDRADYGIFLRIWAVLARETGGKEPKMGKRAAQAVYEIAFTRDQFEPFFSQQVTAIRKERKQRVSPMPLPHRAALVLLGLTRRRRQDDTPVEDGHLQEALSNVERMQKSLARSARRRGSAE